MGVTRTYFRSRNGEFAESRVQGNPQEVAARQHGAPLDDDMTAIARALEPIEDDLNETLEAQSSLRVRSRWVKEAEARIVTAQDWVALYGRRLEDLDAEDSSRNKQTERELLESQITKHEKRIAADLARKAQHETEMVSLAATPSTWVPAPATDRRVALPPRVNGTPWDALPLNTRISHLQTVIVANAYTLL